MTTISPSTTGTTKLGTGVETASGVGSIEEATGSIGVAGGVFLTSLDLCASRFFSSVRRKTRIVVRSDLFGLQSAAVRGLCSQTGHDGGRVDWPV